MMETNKALATFKNPKAKCVQSAMCSPTGGRGTHVKLLKSGLLRFDFRKKKYKMVFFLIK
jgi:hypothetical protein